MPDDRQRAPWQRFAENFTIRSLYLNCSAAVAYPGGYFKTLSSTADEYILVLPDDPEIARFPEKGCFTVVDISQKGFGRFAG